MGSSRQLAACAATLVVACILLLPTLASDDVVDVCPANSGHKSLPFLKAIKPGALAALLTNGLSIDMTAVVDFAKTTLLPTIGANVFFFALALLLLFIFIVWRLLRWCCVVCCCRGSCDLKRSKHDPGEILFGKRMKINKGFMYLFGLVAVAFAIYGLATVDKNVTDGAFNVLTVISNYVSSVFDILDHLINTIKGTTSIIDDFQAIVTVDIEVDAIVANLTAIGTFLDVAPSPVVLLADVTALKSQVTNELKPALADLTSGLSSFSTNTSGGAPGGVWYDRFEVIEGGYGQLTSLKTNVATAMSSVSAVDPNTNPAVLDVTDMKDDLMTMYTAATAGSGWVQQIDDLVQALIYAVGTENPFANLKRRAQLVRTLSSDITGTKVPALTTSINSLVTQYALVAPTMQGLLDKLVYINTTIMELPAAMQTAYTNLADAKAKLDATMTGPPSPGSVATNLTNFVTNMPSLEPLDSLIGNLTVAENALYNAATGFPSATTLTMLTWLGDVRAAVLAVLGPAPATGKLKVLIDGMVTYIGNPVSYSAVMNDHLALTNQAGTSGLLVTLQGKLADNILVAGNDVDEYHTRAGGTKSSPSTVVLTEANTYSGSATAALNTMPDLGNLEGNMGGAKTAYLALGSPPSQVVTEPKNQLATIKDSAITSGNQVKTQINNAVAQFDGQSGEMKKMITGQVDNIRTSYQEPAKTYDGYRYIACMALFGISILFVGLVVAASLGNYHFGVNFSTILLLVITILYFLLATIIALLITALYMGCNELEPMAVKLAPATFKPLLRYYFYKEGATVEAVLKDANLVDINDVRSTVMKSKIDVLSGLTGNFTWRDVPTNPRSPAKLIRNIGAVIDTALGDVDGIITKASQPEMFKMYSEVKGYICCSVPDMLAPMWTGLTMAGVFAVALIICTYFYISKIDHAPRKDCCGCTCHTRSKYAGAVCPNAEQLPQYATPGWEQTPGYVPPNGAMAMHVPWIGAPEHGTVNVVVAGPGGVPKAKAF